MSRYQPAGAAVLAAAAHEAPAHPGVYLFLGASDEVLYVGKAKSLPSRLRQHAAVGAPTSHLHERYELVRRVVWDVAPTETAAAWQEADLIFALRPPFNADPGLRRRDPLPGVARSPFVTIVALGSSRVRLSLEPDPQAGSTVYGCFPHLGKGVSSALGIACSDGYTALLRLLWAASLEGGQVPAMITRSAPAAFDVTIADEWRGGLHRLLSGVSAKHVDTLADAATGRPAFMQPGLARDREAALGFFASGPQRVRARRLRQGIKTTPVGSELYRAMVIDELVGAVGDLTLAMLDTGAEVEAEG